MRREQILLVLQGDDRGLAHLLRQNEFGVDTAANLGQANQLLRFRNYGAILLDGDCNTEEALAFCREYRNGAGEAFLVFISDSSDQDFLVSLFEGGADSTLCNSYHDREIVLRICSLFRRRNGQLISQNKENVRIETQNRIVSKGGKTVRLSVSECQIIEFLLSSPKRTCSTVELLDKLTKQRHAELQGKSCNDQFTKNCKARS